MRTPELGRVVETFVRLPDQENKTFLQLWDECVQVLRVKVTPLVERLVGDGAVGWWSFLIHDRTTGVPVEDDALYVHLRLETAPNRRKEELLARLPDFCLKTRDFVPPDPPTLDNVVIGALAGSRVEEGWRVLGESSEWVLRMFAAHDPTTLVPARNVAQFLHYVGNQTLAGLVRIPMP